MTRKIRYLTESSRFLLLLATSCLFLFPLVWMLLGSLHEPTSLYSGDLLTSPMTTSNYSGAWSSAGLHRALFNSVVVTSVQISLNLVLCTAAGFGFAKFRFRGREPLFFGILGFTLLPTQIIMVPLFLIVKQLGWIDSYQGLIIPIGVSAFGVFLMRQFIAALPDELIDAMRVDGAGNLRILWRLIVPLSRPALVTLAVLTALASWDEFLWPLIVVSSKEMQTMPLAIAALHGLYQAPVTWLLAVATIMVLPPVIAFMLAQRQIVESVGQTGIKG